MTRVAEGTPILELERAEPASAEDVIPPISLRLMQGEFALIDATDTDRAELLADLCCGIRRLVQGQARFLGRDWTKVPHLYADAMRGRIGRVFARGGWITASSACTARPPVCAAWNDVPQPVWTTVAPPGSRRSVGTARNHSG